MDKIKSMFSGGSSTRRMPRGTTTSTTTTHEHGHDHSHEPAAPPEAAPAEEGENRAE